MPDEVLTQLRDIHLPAEPSWWPPAPGWWLLTLLALAGVACLLRAAYAEFRRRRPIRRALALYRSIHEHFEAGALDTRTYLDQTNEVLKRLVVHGLGNDAARRMSDGEWLELLDDHLGASEFTAGPGRVLGHARFRPVVDADAEALHPAVDRLLRRLLRAQHRSRPTRGVPT